MNSIWTLDEILRFKASTIPCDVCNENRRTHSVAVVDPFGVEDEVYSLCDAPECFEQLAKDTIGDGQDDPSEDSHKP